MTDQKTSNNPTLSDYLITVELTGGRIIHHRYKAETYADAVAALYPGNGVMRLTVVELPPVTYNTATNLFEGLEG